MVRVSPDHRFIYARMSATQSTNILANNRVELDTVDESSGHITLSTGAGQANGIFTLIEAGTYRVSIKARINVTNASANLNINLATVGGVSSRIGIHLQPGNTDNDDSTDSSSTGIITVTAGTQVELRITSVVGTVGEIVASRNTTCLIEKIT